MITDAITNGIFSIINTVLNIFPHVTLGDIPYIGTAIRSNLILAMQKWNMVQETLPYLKYSWTAFKIIIAFEVILTAVKFVLGNRTKVGNN